MRWPHEFNVAFLMFIIPYRRIHRIKFVLKRFHIDYTAKIGKCRLIVIAVCIFSYSPNGNISFASWALLVCQTNNASWRNFSQYHAYQREKAL